MVEKKQKNIFSTDNNNKFIYIYFLAVTKTIFNTKITYMIYNR